MGRLSSTCRSCITNAAMTCGRRAGHEAAQEQCEEAAPSKCMNIPAAAIKAGACTYQDVRSLPSRRRAAHLAEGKAGMASGHSSPSEACVMCMMGAGLQCAGGRRRAAHEPSCEDTAAPKCLDMANADVKACYTCHTACGKEGGRRAAHGAEDACEKKCDEGACMPLRAAGAKRDLPSAETRPPTSPTAADTAAAAAADVSELSGASVLSAGLASVLLLAAAQLF